MYVHDIVVVGSWIFLQNRSKSVTVADYTRLAVLEQLPRTQPVESIHEV